MSLLSLAPCVRSVFPGDEVSLRRLSPATSLEHESRIAAHSSGDALYLVAAQDDLVMGHVLLLWSGSRHRHVRQALGVFPEIARLYVAPEYRSGGIARGLLRAAEAAASDRGIDRVGLAVEPATPAEHLYLSSGYLQAPLGPFDSPLALDDRGEALTHRVQYLTKPLVGFEAALMG